jgi:hypothetical protein
MAIPAGLQMRTLRYSLRRVSPLDSVKGGKEVPPEPTRENALGNTIQQRPEKRLRD